MTHFCPVNVSRDRRANLIDNIQTFFLQTSSSCLRLRVVATSLRRRVLWPGRALAGITRFRRFGVDTVLGGLIVRSQKKGISEISEVR